MKDNSNMAIHCGGEIVDVEKLAEYPIPEGIDTYAPVSHFQLVRNVNDIAGALIGMPVCKETYAVAREGQRMFGLITFGDCDGEFGLSIGFRNSYDKSLSIGFCLGHNVFICDNLALSGGVRYVRKHTKMVYQDIEKELLSLLFRRWRETHERFLDESEKFKAKQILEYKGYHIMGQMIGTRLLSPTQATIAYDGWREAIVGKNEFINNPGPNAWSLFMSVTNALKSTPPRLVMEKHAKALEVMNTFV